MRIGVVSDSHGNIEGLKQAIVLMDHPDYIFHLGDYVDDAMAVRSETEIPFFMLRGNMDVNSPYGEEIVQVGLADRKFLACHGHQFNVKGGLNSIFYEGKSRGVDVILYGHTHCAVIEEWDGVLVINPGSLRHVHSNLGKTCAVITIDGDQMWAELISVGKQ